MAIGLIRVGAGLVAVGTLGYSAAGAQIRAPIVQRHHCPFEYGCSFGSHVADGPLAVYAVLDDTTSLVATIPPGEPFTTHEGHMITSQLGLAVVRVETTARRYPYPPRLEPWVFAPGDTVHIVSYSGEGLYTVLVNDTLGVIEGFWTERDRAGIRALQVRRPDETWWVRVTTDEKTGWIALRNQISNGIQFQVRLSSLEPSR